MNAGALLSSTALVLAPCCLEGCSSSDLVSHLLLTPPKAATTIFWSVNVTSHSLAYSTPLYLMTIALYSMTIALHSMSLTWEALHRWPSSLCPFLSVVDMLLCFRHTKQFVFLQRLGSCLGVLVSSRNIVSLFFATNSYFSYKTPGLGAPPLCSSNSWGYFLYRRIFIFFYNSLFICDPHCTVKCSFIYLYVCNT